MTERRDVKVEVFMTASDWLHMREAYQAILGRAPERPDPGNVLRFLALLGATHRPTDRAGHPPQPGA